jgi:hypothetical protein
MRPLFLCRHPLPVIRRVGCSAGQKLAWASWFHPFLFSVPTPRLWPRSNPHPERTPLIVREKEEDMKETSMVGEGIAPSAANPEPCMIVSGHTAPQCMVICD